MHWKPSMMVLIQRWWFKYHPTYRPFSGGMATSVKSLMIVDSWGVKRHVAGKKCIRHYEADKVLASLEMPVSCCAYNCTKTPCEGRRHKVLQVSLWTREPAVVGIRCDWGSNWAYPCMEQLFCWRFSLITTLEVAPVALGGSDDPCSDSNSSKFTDGLNLWPVSHVDFQVLCF